MSFLLIPRSKAPSRQNRVRQVLDFEWFTSGLSRALLLRMRGWIILFTLLTLAFLTPLAGSANERSLQGGNLSGLAVFGTLAAICVVTLIGRTKA